MHRGCTQGEAGSRMAHEYASIRKSMGKTINKHEIIADYLEEMDIDIKALRAITMYSCFHEEVSNKIQMLLDYLD